MSQASRESALRAGGLLHPHPEAVTAEMFSSGNRFFLALDKVQVKYEMLRAHAIDGVSITSAAGTHGYSRAGFYLVQAAFERSGMAGLLDERPGRRGPLKLNDDILAYLQKAPSSMSGAALATEVEARFGVSLHRRTLERAKRQR
jgi:transposase